MARVKPGTSFIGNYLYAFAGFLREFSSGFEGVERVQATTFSKWELLSMPHKFFYSNGLIGLSVIRVKKKSVAIFGGVIVPRDKFNSFTL